MRRDLPLILAAIIGGVIGLLLGGAIVAIIMRGGFLSLSADMPIEGPARFNFGYLGWASSFRVDVSTLPDMSTDVYLDFAVGNTGPLVEADPKKWDAYSCGRVLYWRVTSNRGVQSPIQRTSVVCTEAQAGEEQLNLNAPYTNLSATMPIGGPATFHFKYAGVATNFRVDVSTSSDMSTDVYMSFASGKEGPLVEPNPTKWSAVTCWRRLYWQVVSNRGARSPIQTIIVMCN